MFNSRQDSLSRIMIGAMIRYFNRQLSWLIVLIMIAMNISGCFRQLAGDSSSALAARLNVYGWEGYIPQAVLDGFTRDFGTIVDFRPYESPEQAIEEIKAGEAYDVLIIDSTKIHELIELKLLAPLEYDNIPNFKNVSANFRDLIYDPGNHYSIMIEWGVTGLLVRSDLLATPVNSWNDLWNPALGNKVAIWAIPDHTISISLQSLGYSINSTNQQELTEASNYLQALSKSIVLLEPSLPSVADSLVRGEVVLAYGWSFDARLAQMQNQDISFIIPKEGTILWGDNLAIPVTSARKATAETFINYLLHPEVSAMISNEAFVATPNEAAIRFVEAEVLRDPVIFPHLDRLQNAELRIADPEEIRNLREQIWQDFLASRK